MNIFKYELGQMQANCYFIVSDNQCLIIDPADEASFILEKLQREKLELVGMVATHGHFDHIMAAGGIQLSFDVPFYIHKEDMFLVDRMGETAKHFLGFDPGVLPPQRIEFFEFDKDSVHFRMTIEPFDFEIIYSPGHTPGSCCFYFPANNLQPQSLIFTGDTLFKGDIGRSDFSYSDKKLLDESLAKLFKLPKDTIVYSGHGEMTTIEEEKLFPR